MDGNTFSVAVRQPSFRKDVVKLSVYEIGTTKSADIQISEEADTRELTDGKTHYEAFEPRSTKEWDSCLRVLARYDVKISGLCPYA